ncbi:MAG: hypothetical protein QF828_17380 [Pseudomonadales bacterium]|jgi:hypothetical protein|nr:hypothetical protein [Pseudomonadales bacterium]|tara:strand:+ start:384 stop:635 length:252 start_codon:yes stop_codon:yes gene_type:complete
MSAIPEDLPDDSVYRSIPASDHVEIKATPRELVLEEQREVKRWCDEHSEYHVHPEAVGVEYYPQECRSADDGMWTWYPVVPSQ